MIETSVAILGAGPSGTATAITLAQHGIATVLVDRRRTIGDRPGESLHPGAEPILRQLGVLESIEEQGVLRFPGIEVVRNGVSRFEKFGSDGGQDWLGYHVPRSLLDRLLLDETRRRGVQILDGTSLRSLDDHGEFFSLGTDDRPIRATWIVDATGQASWFARQRNIAHTYHSRKLIVRYGYSKPSNDEEYAIPRFIETDQDWTWLARVDERRIAWVHMKFTGEDPGGDFLPDLLIKNVPVCPIKGAHVTWRVSQQFASERWLLVGDAAATTDPSVSHGVLRALMSGTKAGWLIAQTQEKACTTLQAAKIYESWLREWIRSDLESMRDRYPIVFETNQQCHSV